MPVTDYKIIGQGIYTVSQAARYSGLATPTVDRWAFGYRGHTNIVEPDLPRLGRNKAISFLSLIELCLMSRFKEQGLPATKFRAAAQAMINERGISHPFAFEHLRTDGRDFFMSHGDDAYIQLTGKQKDHMVWELVIEQFFKEIEFEANMARRWHPLKGVVLDPAIKFGEPTIDGTRITTATIFDLIAAGETLTEIGRSYDLELKQIKAARELERRFQIAA